MLKKSVSVLVALSMMTSMLCSCTDGENGVVTAGSDGECVELDRRLEQDAEVREMMTVLQGLVRRAAARRIPGGELAGAAERNDRIEVASLLGIDYDRLGDLSERLERLSSNINERYPSLVENSAGTGASCCTLDDFPELWDAHLVQTGRSLTGDDVEHGMDAPDPANKGVTCKWARYVAALVACGLSAGAALVYMLCAYIATCSYCTGGWVSTICGS